VSAEVPARQPTRDVRLAVDSLAVGRLAIDRLAVDRLDSLAARPSGREVI